MRQVSNFLSVREVGRLLTKIKTVMRGTSLHTKKIFTFFVTALCCMRVAQGNVNQVVAA